MSFRCLFFCCSLMFLGKMAYSQARPNVVIIYADDMGFGDISVQNTSSKIPTPNLDQLARDGIRFTNGHSSSGICSPSRYALLSGKYHWRRFHKIVDSWENSVFEDNEFTLPEMLKQNGYNTACIGKWHLGWDWSSILKSDAQTIDVNGKMTYGPDAFDWNKPIRSGPVDHGFNYYFGDDVPNFPPYCWFENDRVIRKPSVMIETTEETLEGNWEARPGPALKKWDFYKVMPTITKKAVEWIGLQKKDHPFFLYFAWTSPHAPIVPAKEWRGKSGAGPYGDYVMQSDWSAGEILRALKKGGFEENTIVIFIADNGPERYAYDRVRNYDHYSVGYLRGLKRDIWEGGHRIPFIVKWPGNVKPGTVSDELISQIDLFATLAAATDARLPEGSAKDSYNQIGLLKGISKSVRPSLVYNTLTRYAIQKDKWVLIDGRDGGHTKVPEWFVDMKGYKKESSKQLLYNLTDDISQYHNLIDKFPLKAKELKSELIKIMGDNFK